MKIEHRVTLAVSAEQRDELLLLGIDVPTGFSTFTVDEDHASWLDIQRRITQWGAVDITSAKFTKAELTSADWLQLMPDWHFGYPQPKQDEFGYREASFALEDYCELCGIGLIQNAPIQMSTEPKWGKHGIMQLNWIFDEFFTTPEVWQRLFQPRGIECRAVIDPKGKALRTVVQLVVTEEIGVAPNGLSGSSCNHCKRTKYACVTRGTFPPLASKPVGEMAKTVVNFGSGASAQKAVLVSQSLAGALMAAKIRGVSFRPVL